jgi:hypothetical protein
LNAIIGTSSFDARATLREGTMTLFDIYSTANYEVIGAFAVGRDLTGNTCSALTSTTGVVISNALGMGIAPGHTGGRLCYDFGGGDVGRYVVSSVTPAAVFRFYGDSSIARDASHTLFWVRERRPD